MSQVSPLLAVETSFAFGPLFSDGAVLQRDKPIPVWGLASPGAEVKVEFAGQSKSATADRDGRWTAWLDALEPSAVSRTLRASTPDGVLEARDVLVGDVWFCSGQSNMSWALENAPQFADAMASAEKLPIRGWRSPQAPSAQPAFFNASRWTSCVSQTDGVRDMKDWSAAAFFFAREVFQETGVPVGIITTSYGGTMIEAWMNESALKESGLKEVVDRRFAKQLAQLPQLTAEWEKKVADWKVEAAEAAKTGGKPRFGSPRPPEGIGSRRQPSALFNGMVMPFVPFGIRGILWYQGESNVSRPEEYERLFTALIRSWRVAFGQGDLPFYFVQIANYAGKNHPPSRAWAELREAQASALSLPRTGMIVTIDVGEANNLHPKNKLDVGLRLARLALKNDYGKEIPTSGPVFASARPEGGSIRVTFKPGSHLVLREASDISFEVAGADKNFVPAVAKIDGSELVVSSPQVPAPIAVRYAWWGNPGATLFDDSGLPAPPFRSDDWQLSANAAASPATP